MADSDAGRFGTEVIATTMRLYCSPQCRLKADNNQVVVVLQVKRGKGWLAFHRYRTREGGQFTVGYRFTRTDVPIKYLMRAQVRAQGAYPYLQGNSDLLTLIVLPRAPRRGRCEQAAMSRLPSARRRRPTSCRPDNVGRVARSRG